VPATVVVTEPFQGLVQSFAGTLGVGTYNAVVVPHPISSKDLDALRAIAERAAATALSHLGVGSPVAAS
jgi:hypothetical protein